jgi:hypothetical protein
MQPGPTADGIPLPERSPGRHRGHHGPVRIAGSTPRAQGGGSDICAMRPAAPARRKRPGISAIWQLGHPEILERGGDPRAAVTGHRPAGRLRPPPADVTGRTH